MNYIGRTFEYFTRSGEKRIARCKKIVFHQSLKKPIFTGVSPYGNEVTLTRDEIYKFK